jgi:excinuclease ABC subunit A
VRANTTGMLYVLDEPSVGLHASNVAGLRTTIEALVANGNSVVLVEHDIALIRSADWVIELGPGAGEHGGTIIAEGPPERLQSDRRSVIGAFLSGRAAVTRKRAARPASEEGIVVVVGELYNVRDVTARFPVAALSAVSGPSGAGKTALVLESLVPAVRAAVSGQPLPAHVRELQAAGIRQVVGIDAAPIGQNARSTPATYSGAWDHIRRLFSETPTARRRRWTPGHFSFNTRAGQCPTCRGLGSIDLDVQYLPDINVTCPTCHGSRFNDETLGVRVDDLTVADVLGLTIEDAALRFGEQAAIERALRPIIDVGLGYLRLGEPTPSLSGGEAQRLRIASRLRQSQRDVLYVFDEPSTGLHPRDIETLLAVFDRLLSDGATVVAVDHDLDVLAAADHLIDMGPGGGPHGGRIVAQGTPSEVAADPASVTGPWLLARDR